MNFTLARMLAASAVQVERLTVAVPVGDVVVDPSNEVGDRLEPDRPDPTTRREAQPEPKWKSRADRPSRHAHTRSQDQNAEPDKIKCCVVHPGLNSPAADGLLRDDAEPGLQPDS